MRRELRSVLVSCLRNYLININQSINQNQSTQPTESVYNIIVITKRSCSRLDTRIQSSPKKITSATVWQQKRMQRKNMEAVIRTQFKMSQVLAL
jgi:hypothetical protein